MITLPNRLADIARAIEHGEPVNLKKCADLQALDLAMIGRQFVEDAIKSHEAYDDRMEEYAKELQQ